MQWTDLFGHLNLSAVFTHRVFKSELIGLRREQCNVYGRSIARQRLSKRIITQATIEV
jgi:hypothetical protein